MCNLINTHTHTHTHTAWRGGHADARPGRRQSTWWKVRSKDRPHTSQVTYPSNVCASCRSVRRRPGAPGLSVQVLNGNQHKSNHLARNNPRKKASPSRRPKIKYSSPAHCAHIKRPTKVQLPVLQPTNARFTPGRGTAFLKTSGDRYKIHPTRVDMVSVTNAVTFTRTSEDTRVGAIEHPQMPYPRILMDWVASSLRETQTRPRPLQQKVPTKVNSLHREDFCRGE